jgi:hypothetical protein
MLLNKQSRLSSEKKKQHFYDHLHPPSRTLNWTGAFPSEVLELRIFFMVTFEA